MHKRNSVVAILRPFPNQTVVGIVLGGGIGKVSRGPQGLFNSQLLKSKQNLNSVNFDVKTQWLNPFDRIRS